MRLRRKSLGASTLTRSIARPSAWIVSPILLAIIVLGRSSQNMAQTTYPLAGRELLGLNSSTIGLIAAAAGVTGVLSSALVVPRLASRSHLWFLAFGQALGLTAFVFFAVSSNPADIWIGAIALGTGGGIIFPILMTVIGMGTREDRAKALAVFALALSGSLVIGPLLEAGVLHLLHDSLRATFAVLLPLPVAATGAAVAAAVRTGSPGIGRADDGAGANTVPVPAEAIHGHRHSNRKDPLTSSDPAQNPPRSSFWIALLAMSMYQAPFVALVTFGGLLAHYVDHAPPTDIELAFGVFFGVSLAVRAGVTLRSPISRKAEVLVASSLTTVAGVAVLGTTSGLPALFVAMAILGAPHGATLPVASSIVAEHIPRERLGWANGRLMAGTNSITVVIPFICGWLIETVGYRSTFLLLELPVAGFAALLVVRLVRTPLASIPVVAGLEDVEALECSSLPP